MSQKIPGFRWNERAAIRNFVVNHRYVGETIIRITSFESFSPCFHYATKKFATESIAWGAVVGRLHSWPWLRPTHTPRCDAGRGCGDDTGRRIYSMHGSLENNISWAREGEQTCGERERKRRKMYVSREKRVAREWEWKGVSWVGRGGEFQRVHRNA